MKQDREGSKPVSFSPWDATRVIQMSLYAGTKVLGGDIRLLDQHYYRHPGVDLEVVEGLINENPSPESAMRLIKSSLDFVASTGIRVEPEFVMTSAEAVNSRSQNGRIDARDILAQAEQVKIRRLIA